MSKRRIILLAGGVLSGFLIVTLLIIGLVYVNRPLPPQPPELGGQKVPSKIYEISFEKRYDLFCAFFKEEPTTYRNCKILGFTGQEEESAGSKGRYFSHWLVLELSDGRRAYLAPESIKYIEEAAAK